MDILIDKYIMSLYQDLEDEVIADIARRVKKTGRYTETAELMAKSMHEQGYSPAQIRAEVMKMLNADKAYQMAVAENTKAYKQEIQDIINETVKAAKEANDALVAEAGNMAWNNDLSMWQEHGEDLTKPNNMSQLISAARLQTMGALKNLTKTMGFRNTTLGTTGVLNAYQRELDLALIKVSTGTFSFDQAVNDCVHRLAQSGLRSIDYESGRTYQLDTAVRMSIRTGMSQLSGKVMEANLKNSGQDLVITSQHMGSRPEHVPWQNKVFSYSGKSKKYPDFFKSTGYGTVTGLKGINCTHDFYPFWEGASVIPDDIVEPDPVEIDGKKYDYYQATQKQRQMERNIRAIKREIEAQSRLGGPTTELKSMLKAKTNEYQRFSRKAGLKVRDNRLRVEKGSGLPKKHKNSTTKTVTSGTINYRKIAKNETISESLKQCNPMYEKDIAFQRNCQRCVPAYEMRRRGYDVVAKGKYLNYDPIADDYKLPWENPYYKECNHGNGRIELEIAMESFGDGARAEVRVVWKDDPSTAHVFVAEQINGKTIYYDPQNGLENCADYFNYAMDRETSFIRIDNAKPSALISECCEERKNDKL